MLYFKTVKRTVTLENTVLELPMVNKYFWCSRSVYAVEFLSDIYSHQEDMEDREDIWYEMKLIRVQFEDNIIKSCKVRWCKKHPFTLDNLRDDWAKELLEAYIDDSYDKRRKDQFENDFNKVIQNLQNLRP